VGHQPANFIGISNNDCPHYFAFQIAFQKKRYGFAGVKPSEDGEYIDFIFTISHRLNQD
jgi:hypothetical protein